MGTGKDMNVLMVDWAPLAAIPNYGNAQYGAITVGEVLPRLIHHFVEDCKVIALKDVHIIGKPSYVLRMTKLSRRVCLQSRTL